MDSLLRESSRMYNSSTFLEIYLPIIRKSLFPTVCILVCSMLLCIMNRRWGKVLDPCWTIGIRFHGLETFLRVLFSFIGSFVEFLVVFVYAAWGAGFFALFGVLGFRVGWLTAAYAKPVSICTIRRDGMISRWDGNFRGLQRESTFRCHFS